ncbi:MAG TPA: aminotransferase class IV [Acidimicrobiia bacterium]|nr:aminotransferase class IV [Acidimicrobiia bacterium]
MITAVSINGEVSTAGVPVTDSSVLRGDACFEVLRSYAGRPFALAEHLDRLAASAKMMAIELPDREDLSRWVRDSSAELGDGAVRVVVTRGSALPGIDEPSNVIVFGHSWERGPDVATLLPVEAPWHAAGAEWDLAGAKVTSYAPNMAAGRRARETGYDDALLVSRDGMVLEGPTFSVAWVVDGVMETPGLDLGILDSITRRFVIDLASRLGLTVNEGRWQLSRLDEASEVMALSTIREVQAVGAVGTTRFVPGPVTQDLAVAFASLVTESD